MLTPPTNGAARSVHLPAIQHQQTSATTPTPHAAQPRDVRTWPFAQKTIWNMPIGNAARYVAAGIGAPTAWGVTEDEDIIVMTPDAPLTDVFENFAGWDAAKSRCSKDGKLLTRLPIPANFVYDQQGGTPNAASAVLLADGVTLHQSQPFQRCTAGGFATTQFVFAPERIDGDGIRGAHGGSGMSSLGGTLRMGDLLPNTTIRDALKMNLNNRKYFAYNNDSTSGYRWPAIQADSDARTSYGGTVPALEIGALLALKPDFDINALQTEPAKIMARALLTSTRYSARSAVLDVVVFV